MNTQPHCSLSYHKFYGSDLETFAHAVGTGIFTHSTPFATPPLTQGAYTTLVETYHDSTEAYKNGGKNQKGDYLTAKTNLMAGIDSLAEYVDELPGVNEDMITLAGFTPTKTGESQAVVPAAPVIDGIEQGVRGELIPNCQTVAGADYYGCVVSEVPLEESIFSLTDGIALITGQSSNPVRIVITKGRKKNVVNLTPRVEYWFYYFAGNSAGVSQLSNGLSRVCS